MITNKVTDNKCPRLRGKVWKTLITIYFLVSWEFYLFNVFLKKKAHIMDVEILEVRFFFSFFWEEYQARISSIYNRNISIVHIHLRAHAAMGANPQKSQWTAYKAIDGNTSQIFMSKSCAITDWYGNQNTSIWWIVWLERQYNMAYLEMYFRIDSKLKYWDINTMQRYV